MCRPVGVYRGRTICWLGIDFGVVIVVLCFISRAASLSCADTPCQNHGTCTNSSVDTLGYNCTCGPCYTGTNCSTKVDMCTNSSCLKGVCLTICPGNGVNPFTFCTCFSGATCETATPCAYFPCQNGGSCYGHRNDYNCTCMPGWTGKNCSQDVDECSFTPSVCEHNANCTNTVGSYMCNCSNDGFQGKNCSIDVNECLDTYEFAPVCKHNGTCNNTYGSYVCNCTDPGWTGASCNDDVDECRLVPAVCEHNATCVNSIGSYSCLCNGSGYEGQHCSMDINECLSSYPLSPVCKNGGICTNSNGSYSCNCTDTGWTGLDCSADVNECSGSPPPCQHDTPCINSLGSFSCLCNGSGYQGKVCSEDVDECSPTFELAPVCKHNSQCTNYVGNYSCNCSGTGFTDSTCSTDIDECAAAAAPFAACSSHGNCTNTPGSFSCSCTAGFLPPVCIVADPCAGNPSYCGSSGSCAAVVVNNSAYLTCSCASSNQDPRQRCAPLNESQNIIPIAVGSGVGGVVFIVIVVVIVLGVLAKQKRAMQGAYSPSRQEMSGSRSEIGNVLKPPPEERLI